MHSSSTYIFALPTVHHIPFLSFLTMKAYSDICFSILFLDDASSIIAAFSAVLRSAEELMNRKIG
jgi:hypothetical protein